MSKLLFSNGALLAGLVALIIPILIHLLLKRKKQRLRFSTIQFFVQQDERSSRRQKLRHWLLLATRLLLLSLLVVAFARPYLYDAASADDRPVQQVVFVLDRSASMRTEGRWRQALDALARSLAELRAEDQAALVEAAAPARTLRPMAPAAQLAAELQNLMPGFGAANLAEGLKAAVKILSDRKEGRLSGIHLVTDGQNASCQGLSGIRVPDHVELKVHAAGELETPNLALSGLQLDATGSGSVTLSSFSKINAKEVELEVRVDGALVQSAKIDLPPSGSTNVPVVLPSLKPGWHGATATIRAQERFQVDDVCYLAFQVPEPLRVLCLEPRQTHHVFEEESFFLTTALNPHPDAANGLMPRFTVKKLNAEALVQTLRGPAGQSQFDLVLAPALRRIPEGCGEALAGFVRQGGGLVLFVGDGLSAVRYNIEFRDLLPAVLGVASGGPDQPEARWHLERFDKAEEVFAAFRGPESGDLTIPIFHRRQAVRLRDGARVLARFSGGEPFLVADEIGRGRVVLVNTSADASWTDWPRRKTFVPWLHGIALYAARRSAGMTSATAESFLPGDEVAIEFGSDAANRPVRFARPGGNEETGATDRSGQARFELEQPGFYSLLDESGREVRRLAANPPKSESDPTSTGADELLRQITQTSTTENQAAGLLDPSHREKHFWRMLLLGGGVLLLLELLLANRTLA